MTHPFAKVASENTSPSCWVVTDGRVGMENQCLGLAEALGVTPTVKRIVLRTPWKQLSPFLRILLSYAVSSKGDPIAPPWPDLLIASGRASVPVSLFVRRMSASAGEKRTFTVQIQNPVIDPSYFDLVVAPHHDRLEGPNVMSTRGGLHRVTSKLLSEEANRLLPQLKDFPEPRIAVVIGGSSSAYTLNAPEMEKIAAQLRKLAVNGKSLLITTSRRTGAENLAILQNALRGTPSFIWDGQGHNPYYGMLGLAEAILVTCDSVNMISEACSTGKPVMIIDLPGGSEKFQFFHKTLRESGMTRPFRGTIESWTYEPLDEMRLVAERVKQMMNKRS